jgi:hypothetical protein
MSVQPSVSSLTTSFRQSSLLAKPQSSVISMDIDVSTFSALQRKSWYGRTKVSTTRKIRETKMATKNWMALPRSRKMTPPGGAVVNVNMIVV